MATSNIFFSSGEIIKISILFARINACCLELCSTCPFDILLKDLFAWHFILNENYHILLVIIFFLFLHFFSQIYTVKLI